ncbi:MAG: clostripain-related cysteine peptidase [Turneriella sp.]
MKFFSRTLRIGILGLALTMLNCQQLMDLLDKDNKVDETSANTNTDLDKAGSWMTLVYLDADNNLEGAGVGDVNEMLANYANFGGNRVIVLMDRIANYSGALITITGDGATTCPATVNYNNQPSAYLFEITSSTTVKCVTTLPASFTQGSEPDMGAQATLTNFLTWGLNEAKAGNFDYVYLDIWDHGAGWGGGAYSGGAVAWDDTDAHNALTIARIQNAMRSAQSSSGKKVTILGFDACYMGTFENAYSFKDLASVMIGSEEVEPGAGWDYLRWTPRGKVSPRTVATNVVTTFKAFYSGSGEDVTLAAYDLSKVAGVTSALDAFLNKVTAVSPTAISSARQQSQSYNNDLSIDFYDFVDKVNIAESAALKNMINSLMVAEAHTAGGKVNGSHGVTIYFPSSTSTYDSYNATSGGAYSYTLTDFAKATRWDDFIGGKLTGSVAAATEPGDASCGSESNDTAGTAIKLPGVAASGNYPCTGYIFTASDVDIHKFGATWAAGTDNIEIMLSNIPAGANFDVLLFNTDVSPSAPIASGSIASGNAREYFKFYPTSGKVDYPDNTPLTCDPDPATSSNSLPNQGLCYGQGLTGVSNANFYIVIVGKNNSYSQVGKYTLTIKANGLAINAGT